MSIFSQRTPESDALVQAILSLKDPDDAYAFFEDLCTINEFVSMTQRFQVAALLSQGKTFNSVSEATGASPATISRVNRCLKYGNGYARVLKSEREENEENE